MRPCRTCRRLCKPAQSPLILYQAGCAYALISAEHADDRQLAVSTWPKPCKRIPHLRRSPCKTETLETA